MNIEIMRLIPAALALIMCCMLGGCGVNDGKTALEAEIELGIIQDADIITMSEAAERFAAEFARAYFCGDSETAEAMLVSPYENMISVYDGAVPETMTVTGAEAADAAENGMAFAVNVEFPAENGETAVLKLELLKTENGFQVQYYAMED